jgi:hypothetical protein
MTKSKEHQAQKALGTLPTYFVKLDIKVPIHFQVSLCYDALNEKEVKDIVCSVARSKEEKSLLIELIVDRLQHNMITSIEDLTNQLNEIDLTKIKISIDHIEQARTK